MGHRRHLRRRLRRGRQHAELGNSPAQAGSRAGLLINKPLTIRGAGADKVTIRPAASAAPSLAGTAPYLRDGGGAVIQVNRQSGGSSDYTENFVDISGVTVTSPDVYAEAGVAFFNTSGRISNSVIGPLKRAADAAELAARPHGWGVIMTNSIQGASEAAVRRELTIEGSLVMGYQSGGILFDDARGIDGAAANTLRSGILEYGYVRGTRVAGAGPDTTIPQTGVRYHAGARGSIAGSEIADNSFTPDPRKSAGVLLTDAETGPDPSNPAVRAFSLGASAITGNGFGLVNADIANTAPRPSGGRATRLGPASAGGNWWGCAAGPGNPGCDPVAGGAGSAIELGTPLTTPPAPLNVPAVVADDPPTGSFVDPGEGDDVAVGQTITPAVLAGDDFGREVRRADARRGAAGHRPAGALRVQLDADLRRHRRDAHVPGARSRTPPTRRTVLSRHVDVPLPAGYEAATLAPLSWDAGTILVGYEATRTFTLTNSGQNPLTIGTIGLTGDASFSIVAAPNVCAASSTLAVGASCTIIVRFAPLGEGPRTGALSVGYAAPGAGGPLVAALAGTGHILSTTVPGTVAGTVPPTLGLTISSASSSFGTFIPGVAADYTTSVALGVTHSTGGAALTVQDPSPVATGHLVNGDLSLLSPLLARAGSSAFAPIGSGASPLALQAFPAPVVNEPVAVTFKQPISDVEPLRTGSYAKTVLFTLSSTSP